MLYLTCTTITSVDLAHYGVSRAKDWVSVDCGTKCVYKTSDRKMKLHNSFMCLETSYTFQNIQNSFFFLFFGGGGGGGGRLGAELREIEKAGLVN